MKYWIPEAIQSCTKMKEGAKRTIRQQYDKMNQSIFNSSFLSSFDCGTSPHTKCRTLRQVLCRVIFAEQEWVVGLENLEICRRKREKETRKRRKWRRWCTRPGEGVSRGRIARMRPWDILQDRRRRQSGTIARRRRRVPTQLRPSSEKLTRSRPPSSRRPMIPRRASRRATY